MSRVVTKTQLQLYALAYVRQIEPTVEEAVVTAHGNPALKTVSTR